MARPGQFLLLLLVAAFVAHAHGRRNHGRYNTHHHEPYDYHRPRGHHHHHQSSSTVPSTTPSTTYFPVYDGTTNYPMIPMAQYKVETDVPKADEVPNVNAEAEPSDILDNGNNIDVNAPAAEDRSNVDDNRLEDVIGDGNDLGELSPGVDDINPDSNNPDGDNSDSNNHDNSNPMNIDEITPVDEDTNNGMDVGNGNLLDNPNGGENTINDNDLTPNSVDIGPITTPGTIFINGSTPPPDPPRHYISKHACIVNENGRCEDEKPNINNGGLSSGGGAAHQGPSNSERGDLGADVTSNLPDEIIPSGNGHPTEKPIEHGHHSNKNKTVVLPVYLPGLGSHVMYPGGPVVAQNDKIPAFYIVIINGQATLVKNPAAVVGGTGSKINQGSVVLADNNISLGDLAGINSGSLQLPWLNIGTGGSNVGGNIGVLPQQPIWIGSQYPSIGGLNIGGGFPSASIIMPSIIPNEQPLITESVAVPVPEPVQTGSFIYPNIGYGNSYWPSMWPGMNPQMPNVNVNLTNPWYTNPTQNVNWPNILNLLLNLLSQVPNGQLPNPVPGVAKTDPTPNHPGSNNNLTPTSRPFVSENTPGGNHFNPGGPDGNPGRNDYDTPTPSPFVTIPNVPEKIPGGNHFNPDGPNRNPGENDHVSPTSSPFVTIPNIPEKIPGGNHFNPSGPDENPGRDNYATPTPSPFVTIPNVPEKIPGGNHFNPDGPDRNPKENDYVTPTPIPFVTVPNIPDKIPGGNNFNPGGPDGNPGRDNYATPTPSPFVTIPNVPEKVPGGNHFNTDGPDRMPKENDYVTPTPIPFVTVPDIPEKIPGGNNFNPGSPDEIPDRENYASPTPSPFVTIPNVPEKIPGGNHFKPDGPDRNPEENDHITPTPRPFVTVSNIPEKVPGGNNFNPDRSDEIPDKENYATPTPSSFVTIPNVPDKIPGGNNFNLGGPDRNPGENDYVTPTPSPFVTVPNIPGKVPGGNHFNPGGPDQIPDRENNATPTPSPFVTIPNVPDKIPGGKHFNSGDPDAHVTPNGRPTPGPDVMRTPEYGNDLTSRPTPTYPELIIPMTTPKPNLNHPKPNHPRPGPHEHDPAIINLLNILLKVPPTTSTSNNRVPQPNPRPSPHPHPKDNDQVTKLLLELLKKEGGNHGNDAHKEKVPTHPRPNIHHPNSDNLVHLLAHLLEGHNQPNLNILLEPGMDESRTNLMLILSLLASQMGSDYGQGMNYYQQYPPLRSENPLLYFLGHFPCEQSAIYGNGQSGVQRGLWQLLSNMYGMNSIRFDRSAEETDEDKTTESDPTPVDIKNK